VFINSFILFAF